MAKTTPAPESPAEDSFGIATIGGREIKVKRLEPDQLIAADMMARRLQRMADARNGDGKFPEDQWQRFLDGTRRLLDWVGNQIVDVEDLDWFEEEMLNRRISLKDIGPLMEAMGAPQEETKKPVRKARRAR